MQKRIINTSIYLLLPQKKKKKSVVLLSYDCSHWLVKLSNTSSLHVTYQILDLILRVARDVDV